MANNSDRTKSRLAVIAAGSMLITGVAASATSEPRPVDGTADYLIKRVERVREAYRQGQLEITVNQAVQLAQFKNL